MALVRTVVTLAAGLGRSVVAPGVESAWALAVLRELGRGDVQGYLVS